MKVLGVYVFGYRCLIATKTAMNRTAENHVGTNADMIETSDAEPLGLKSVSIWTAIEVPYDTWR
jgi:hypothetical protein